MAFHAIIPAGGVGSRLWPLSRAAHPKFLADFTGAGTSMLQQTVARVAPMADSITVVTGAAHAEDVRTHVPQVSVLVEPSMRGTMAAIGLATALVHVRDREAIVGSFAADHHIADERAFRAALARAIEAAGAGYVATIGVAPTSPATAYGYIRAGEPIAGLAPGEPEVFTALEFVEKPDEARAAAYCATGEYSWNAGMFVARADVLLNALERFHPEIAAPLKALATAWEAGESERAEALARLWEPLPTAVIDRAIAEPLAREGGVALVPADMGWSDIGDFASLAAILPEAQRLHQVSPGGLPQEVITVDSPRALVYSHSKPIAIVGIEDAVVVEMDDVIFLASTQAAQRVKDVVESLNGQGLPALH